MSNKVNSQYAFAQRINETIEFMAVIESVYARNTRCEAGSGQAFVRTRQPYWQSRIRGVPEEFIYKDIHLQFKIYPVRFIG